MRSQIKGRRDGSYVDVELLKSLISRLTGAALSGFILEMLKGTYDKDDIRALAEVGPGVFRTIDAMEWNNWDRSETVHIVHPLPVEILKRPETAELDDPLLLDRINRVLEIDKARRASRAYEGAGPEVKDVRPFAGLYFETNCLDTSAFSYTENVWPRYKALLKRLGFQIHYEVGNPNTYVESDPVLAEDAFSKLILAQHDGLCINLAPRSTSASLFRSEKYLVTGVGRKTYFPYEPVFVSRENALERVIKEFSDLLSREPRESAIEEFLRAHYREIFGAKYDRIETQLWLRFPELDIAGKERRVDLFLRNCVANDWELFEVKRTIALEGTYRDVPVLAGEISKAILQVKSYERLLVQSTVKQRFAEEGIIYFEPSLHLVAGRKPQISHEQWRWLTSQADGVKLITYDDLLDEMRTRLENNP